jgi:hypothetical protein
MKGCPKRAPFLLWLRGEALQSCTPVYRDGRFFVYNAPRPLRQKPDPIYVSFLLPSFTPEVLY